MRVCRNADDKWIIERADGSVHGVYETNSEAWRALDRLQNEPINKREDATDWAWRQRLDQ